MRHFKAIQSTHVSTSLAPNVDVRLPSHNQESGGNRTEDVPKDARKSERLHYESVKRRLEGEAAYKNTKIHLENQGNQTLQVNLCSHVTPVITLLMETKTSIFSSLDSTLLVQ